MAILDKQQELSSRASEEGEEGGQNFREIGSTVSSETPPAAGQGVVKEETPPQQPAASSSVTATHPPSTEKMVPIQQPLAPSRKIKDAVEGGDLPAIEEVIANSQQN